MSDTPKTSSTLPDGSLNDPGDPRARADALSGQQVGQSRLGLVGLALCLITAVAVVLLLMAASKTPLEKTGLRGLGDERVTMLMLLVLGAMAIGFLGAVLGLLGLFEPGRRRGSAVAAIITNCVVILITIFTALAGGTFG